jgi:enoyl-CoA hydratase
MASIMTANPLPRVRVQTTEHVTTLTLDDGKVNAMSPAMFTALNAALDEAQAAGTVVVIRGRPGVFSAGFDLATLRAGGDVARQMLLAGARLTERLLSFPAPVLAVLTGPAMAMGAFLALSADARLALDDGRFKIAANEVAIGLTLPRFAATVLRHRLTPAHCDLAAITARPADARSALAGGWIDDAVPAAQLDAAVDAGAAALAMLDRAAHVGTKLRMRASTLSALREAISADEVDWRARI